MTSEKKPSKKSSRLYIKKRNSSVVCLRDLPDHLVTGVSKAQLTPIFSIIEADIYAAFEAQLSGDVNDYFDLIELKQKFSSSKLERRTDSNPQSFGWIDDKALLMELPEEYKLLREHLDRLLSQFAPIFLDKTIERLASNVQLVSTIGAKVELGSDAQTALDSLK